MLYLVSYKFYNPHDEVYIPFFEALDDLGENIMIYDGAYLLDCVMAVGGVRAALLPHVGKDDLFLAVQMYEDHSAGQLKPRHKEFIRWRWSFDPSPYVPPGDSYSF